MFSSKVTAPVSTAALPDFPLNLKMKTLLFLKLPSRSYQLLRICCSCGRSQRLTAAALIQMEQRGAGLWMFPCKSNVFNT